MLSARPKSDTLIFPFLSILQIQYDGQTLIEIAGASDKINN